MIELMRMKKIIKVIIVLFFLLASFLVLARLFVGGGEDTWICVDGEWVKHGVPSAPMPTGGCGEKTKTELTPTMTSSSGGEDLEQRLKTLKDNLHNENSGTEAKQLFPDLTPVYTDDGYDNPQFPKEILPFIYYYSQEADITVSICNINQTVFICPGKLERLITPADYKNCQVTAEYLQIKP